MGNRVSLLIWPPVCTVTELSLGLVGIVFVVVAVKELSLGLDGILLVVIVVSELSLGLIGVLFVVVVAIGGFLGNGGTGTSFCSKILLAGGGWGTSSEGVGDGDIGVGEWVRFSVTTPFAINLDRVGLFKLLEISFVVFTGIVLGSLVTLPLISMSLLGMSL